MNLKKTVIALSITAAFCGSSKKKPDKKNMTASEKSANRTPEERCHEAVHMQTIAWQNNDQHPGVKNNEAWIKAKDARAEACKDVNRKDRIKWERENTDVVHNIAMKHVNDDTKVVQCAEARFALHYSDLVVKTLKVPRTTKKLAEDQEKKKSRCEDTNGKYVNKLLADLHADDARKALAKEAFLKAIKPTEEEKKEYEEETFKCGTALLHNFFVPYGRKTATVARTDMQQKLKLILQKDCTFTTPEVAFSLAGVKSMVLEDNEKHQDVAHKIEAIVEKNTEINLSF